MTSARQTYVVNTGEIPPETRATVVRTVIGVLSDAADKFECDIPLSLKDAWPHETREAAEYLAALRQPRRSENADYRRTGVRSRVDDPAAWAAFVTFAAHAYDAAVWDERRDQLLSLADEGNSLVARLTDEEAAIVADRFPDVQLVPLSRWRKRSLLD